MRIENPEPEMLTQAAIIKRGWSQAMIEKLLGAPDGSGRNPVYRSASPVRLYLLSRVEAAEATGEYAELLRKRQARGKARKP